MDARRGGGGGGGGGGGKGGGGSSKAGGPSYDASKSGTSVGAAVAQKMSQEVFILMMSTFTCVIIFGISACLYCYIRRYCRSNKINLEPYLALALARIHNKDEVMAEREFVTIGVGIHP